MAKAQATNVTVEQEKQELVRLSGKLVDDPELRHTRTSGKAVTTLRVMVEDEAGMRTYHSVVVWGRTAEIACARLEWGSEVKVIGREQEREYDDADGITHTVREVVALRVKFPQREATTPSEKELS